MRTIRLRATALICAYCLAAPFSAFAQTASEITSNLAEPAMQRVLARAITAAFATLSPYDESSTTDQAQGRPPEQTKPPPGNPGPPSLNDLGLPAEQTQGNLQEQARLDRRSRMLRTHQRLGLITTIPMVATVLTGGFAGGRSTASANRDLHAALGSATAGLYFTTAYFSVFAPRVPGTQARGPIRLHKALAWIHGPGMILTPILGVMAFEQKNRGERIHGIATAHGAVGIVTAGAFGLAIASVSFKF